MDKIKRATEIHRTMTPHQMALRIVELEDIAEIVGQHASDRSKRIAELQDALELAEEEVRAKQSADIPDGWQLVPTELTEAMGDAVYEELGSPTDGWYGFDDAYRSMLSAAPKPQCCASWNNAHEKPGRMSMERFVDQYFCVFNASDEPKPEGGAA